MLPLMLSTYAGCFDIVFTFHSNTRIGWSGCKYLQISLRQCDYMFLKCSCCACHQDSCNCKMDLCFSVWRINDTQLNYGAFCLCYTCLCRPACYWPSSIGICPIRLDHIGTYIYIRHIYTVIHAFASWILFGWRVGDLVEEFIGWPCFSFDVE